MKKFIILIAALFLTGCSEGSFYKTDVIDEIKVTDRLYEWCKPAFENDDTIYYVSQKGIVKHSGKSNLNELLLESDSVNSIYLTEQSIFFDDDARLYQMSLDGKDKKLIFDRTKYGDIKLASENYLIDYMVYQDNVYLKNTVISVIKINLSTSEISDFSQDVSHAVFLNNSFYYTDHAQRTFSIHEKDLQNLDSKVIRGDGETYFESEGNLFDELAVVNEEMYYTTRVPSRIYLYSAEGTDKLIADFSANSADTEFVHLLPTQAKLFYTINSNGSGKALYEYDSITNKHRMVLSIKEPISYLGAVEDTLFYFDKTKKKTVEIVDYTSEKALEMIKKNYYPSFVTTQDLFFYASNLTEDTYLIELMNRLEEDTIPSRLNAFIVEKNKVIDMFFDENTRVFNDDFFKHVDHIRSKDEK